MRKGKVPAPLGLKKARQDCSKRKTVKRKTYKKLKKPKRKLVAVRRVTITGSIFSNARHSMDAVASLHLLSPGGMFLSFSMP